MKKIYSILAVVFLCISAFGQGGVKSDAALKVTGGPAAGAQVRVCSSTSGGTPCSPLATIYSDASLSIVKTNPFSADAYGNYSYFAEPGLYREQIKVGVTTQTRVVQVAASTKASLQNLNAIRFADKFPSIQAAITDAGTTGAVIIPPGYSATQSYSNASNVPVWDLRGGVESLRVWSQIGTSQPITDFPLGNDLVLNNNGPADTYLTHNLSGSAARTTSTTLNVGANNNVLVSGSLANFSTSAGLQIGRGTANYETVIAANWRRVDDTHINVTCANPHVGNTDIEQIGSTIIRTPVLIFDGNTNKPSQQSTSMMELWTASNEQFIYVPHSIADTWPLGGLQVQATLTGAQGATKDLFIRSNGASSRFIYVNAAGTANPVSWDDSGNFDVVGPHIKVTGTTPALAVADSTAVTGKEYRLASGSFAGGTLSLVDQTAGANVFTYEASDGLRIRQSFAIGASGAKISDSRKLIQATYDCGTTTTCANTTNNSDWIVRGTVALSSASPSTAVVASITPAFTSTSTYNCTATNMTTQANPVKVANTSTSSITITGPNTVTDTISYICIGH